MIAHAAPTEVRLGGALITMVEPGPGKALEYNRWYEDDHFYAGATTGPFTFAARRFVATRDLKQARIVGASESEEFRALTAKGSYISLYWILAGHLDDNRRWSIARMIDHLTPAGRGYADREHIYTSFHDWRFTHVFDAPPMQDVHALDHPYAGIAVEILDRDPAATGESLVAQVERLVELHRGDPQVGQCIAFVPLPLPEKLSHVKREEFDLTRSVCLLWFLKEDPRIQWPGRFANHASVLPAGGRQSRLIAPYIPTVPGTNWYAD